MRPDLEKTRIMTTIINSVRATMAGAMKEAMKIPEVQVNVLRANGLTSFLSSLRGWAVPLGMIAGASAAPGGGAPLRARFDARARAPSVELMLGVREQQWSQVALLQTPEKK